MRCVICGAGHMGLATIWAMHELGYKIDVIDTSKAALEKVDRKYPFATDKINTHNGTGANYYNLIIQADIVISTLPYYANFNLAIVCVNNGVPYCDLGGHIRTSELITKYAMKTYANKCGVFTDLGLAPGWVNIIAEHGYQTVKSHDIKEIEMCVGGLPVIDTFHDYYKNPLQYVCTWSMDGLINEYLDDCIILKDNEIQTVKGMDGLEDYGQYEYFYTSGGSAHTINIMKERGVSNCIYQTLRYAGHNKLVKWILDTFGKEGLIKAFEAISANYLDEVRIMVDIECEDGTDWSIDNTIEQHIMGNSDSIDCFTAMQKCTAFPLATVASMIAKDKLPAKSVLSYEDVPYEEFDDILSKLFKSYENEYMPEWLKEDQDAN